jgi:hypothetical protein
MSNIQNYGPVEVTLTGDAGVFRIPIMHKCYIHRLIVVQTSGVGEFTVDLLNSGGLYPIDTGGEPDVSSSLSSMVSGDSNPDEPLYRAIPTKDSASGVVAYYNDTGMPYRNADESKTDVADKRYEAFVKIVPDGAGIGNTYKIVLTCCSL